MNLSFDSDHILKTTLGNIIQVVIDTKKSEANLISAEISNLFLSRDKFETPKGATKEIKALKNETLNWITRKHGYQGLEHDKLFEQFAQKMCIIAVRHLCLNVKHLKENPLKAEAFIEHLETHYKLLKELGVPSSIIKSYAHAFSIFEVDKIISESKFFFGRSSKTKKLPRTAAFLVLNKQYPSIQKVYEDYYSKRSRDF